MKALSSKLQVEYTKGGPPLDFSSKNLTSFEEILRTEQRSGKRLPIPEEEVEEKKDAQLPLQSSRHDSNSRDHDLEDESPQKAKQVEPFKQPLPPAAQKVLAEYTTSKVAAGAMVGGPVEDNPHIVTRKQEVRTITNSLILSYNQIPDLGGFTEVLGKVMRNYQNIRWLDLSNNHLTRVSPELRALPILLSLYFHCNFVFDMKELESLEQSPIKSLTMHGNPIDQIPGYRMWTICLVPQLKRLDTVLVTKLETDNALGFMKHVNKRRTNLPKQDNPPMPKSIRKLNTQGEATQKDTNK